MNSIKAKCRGSKFSQLTHDLKNTDQNIIQNKRIIGIDVARAFAIFLMIIIHFFELNPSIYNNPTVYNQAYFLFGRARFIFFLIAGIGLFYLSKSARTTQNRIALNYTKSRIMIRGVFIGLTGIILNGIMDFTFHIPITILIVYGVFFFLFSFLFNRSKKFLVALLGLMMILYVIFIRNLIIANNLSSFSTISYFLNFWLYIFLEGFTIILLGFLLANFIINKKYLMYFVITGTILLLIPFLLEKFFSNFLTSINLYNFSNSAGVSLEKPLIDYISRTGSTLILVPIINIISSAFKKNILSNALALSGQHAFTLYIIQILAIPIISSQIILNNGFQAVIAGLILIIICILFANLNYVTKYTRPFELLVRHFSDTYKNIKVLKKPFDPAVPPFNISEFNQHYNFCTVCGSKLNFRDPQYLLSLNRDTIGQDIHKEALKGIMSEKYFWMHINNIRYLFNNYPDLNKISASEVYCSNDLTIGLRLIQENIS